MSKIYTCVAISFTLITLFAPGSASADTTNCEITMNHDGPISFPNLEEFKDITSNASTVTAGASTTNYGAVKS